MFKDMCLTILLLFIFIFQLIIVFYDFTHNKNKEEKEEEKRTLVTLSINEKDYQFLISEMQKNDATISIKHGEDMQCWSIAQISTKNADISAGKEH